MAILRNVIILLLISVGVAGALPCAPVAAQQDGPSWVNALDWSPDSTKFVTGHLDGTIKIWEASTNRLLAVFPPAWSDSEFNPVINALVWHPDGTRIAACVQLHPVYGEIWILDAATGHLMHSIETGVGCWDVAWSPDGTQLAGAVSYLDVVWGDNIVDIWDAASGEPVTSLKGHTSWISTIAWSPDGSHIASGSTFKWQVDGNVIIWDTTTGLPLFTLTGHTGNVYSVAWDSDGSRLASAGSDGTIRIWDPATGEPLVVLQNNNNAPVSAIDWRPDGSQIAGIVFRGVTIWDTESYQVVSVIAADVSLSGAKWSPDNTRLIYGGLSLTETRIVNLPLEAPDAPLDPVPTTTMRP